MKKPVLVLVGAPVLFVLLAVSMLVLVKLKAAKSIPATVSSTEVVAQKPVGGFPTTAQKILTATLFKESGEVAYKTNLTDQYQMLTQDALQVAPGTYVKTGKGLAHVILPDNSMMSVSENTEVQVNFAESKTSIIQVIGKTFHRVEKILQGNSYEVETPTTLATVRGTVFGVDVTAAQNATIYVSDSIVAVAKIEKKPTGEKIIKTAENVTAGKEVEIKKADVANDKKLAILNIPLKQRNDPWFVRNALITTEFKQKLLEMNSSPAPGATPGTQLPRLEFLKDIQKDPAIQKVDVQRQTLLKNIPSLMSTNNTNLFQQVGLVASPIPGASSFPQSSLYLKTEPVLKLYPTPTATPTLKTLDTTKTPNTITTYPTPTASLAPVLRKVYPSPTPTPTTTIDKTFDTSSKIQLSFPSPSPTPVVEKTIFYPEIPLTR